LARYIALIDGEAGAYGVVFPDCPGCTAMAATMDDALAQATDTLREWMADRVAAGLAVPNARSAEEIRSDPAATEDLGSGAVIASVPLLLDSGRSVRANLSFDAGLLSAIDAAARERGLTRSAFLASAAREKITSAR
jgi:predicted RNase H-like HicB family nuclease